MHDDISPFHEHPATHPHTTTMSDTHEIGTARLASAIATDHVAVRKPRPVVKLLPRHQLLEIHESKLLQVWTDCRTQLAASKEDKKLIASEKKAADDVFELLCCKRKLSDLH